jgi:hypothetical protein
MKPNIGTPASASAASGCGIEMGTSEPQVFSAIS